MIHPGRANSAAHKASSISLSAKLRAFESGPQEAQICPHHETAQPHCWLGDDFGTWQWILYKRELFSSVLGHFIDYLQDLRAFNTLILLSFMTWHCPDELTTHEMLGTFCFQSSDRTQGTHDRTFCQPGVRIFKHFHIRLSTKLNYFRTKIKNCNCKRH